MSLSNFETRSFFHSERYWWFFFTNIVAVLCFMCYMQVVVASSVFLHKGVLYLNTRNLGKIHDCRSISKLHCDNLWYLFFIILEFLKNYIAFHFRSNLKVFKVIFFHLSWSFEHRCLGSMLLQSTSSLAHLFTLRER